MSSYFYNHTNKEECSIKQTSSDIKYNRALRLFNSKPSIDYYMINNYDMYLIKRTNGFFLKEYQIYNNKNNSNAHDEFEYKDLNMKILKYSFYTLTSLLCVKYFKSILIIPVFLFSVYTSKAIITSVLQNYNKIDSNDKKVINSCKDCYFCMQKERYELNKIKYSLYNELLEECKDAIIQNR